MFYLMARKSNMMPDSATTFDPSKQLQCKDVLVYDTFLTVRFKWSKTIQYKQREHRVPVLAVPGSHLCPVTAFKHMTKLTNQSGDSPAFIWSDKSGTRPLSYPIFMRVLKSLIKQSGRDERKFSSHSFRRGGATFEFQAGFSPELIQLIGDWRSDAYKAYLKPDLQYKTQAMQNIRRVVAQYSHVQK